MTNKQKRHIIASVGTVLFMLLLFMLLWFIYLTAVVPEEEEGIEVAFGEVEEAGGYMAEQSEAVPMPSPEPAAPKKPTAPTVEEHITTDDPEALALAEAKKKREAEEKARLEAERKAREAAEAERKAKEAEAIAKANAMGSLFGQSGNNAGSGDSQGSGQKGNPIGHGSSGGNSWSLSGRGIKGTLPQPANTFNQEGKVVVQIRVNAAGQVVNATITGGDVSDKQTQQLALDAARKAKFTEGDHDQIGTITYIFKLN
ncbi:MAG: TonB family protein [Paludibacteraceae bacterium]|nr:TonB family protein [Paludibacteraceae bacterium]